MAVTMMVIFIVFSPECRREGHWDWSQSYRSFGIGVDLPRALAFLLKVSRSKRRKRNLGNLIDEKYSYEIATSIDSTS